MRAALARSSYLPSAVVNRNRPTGLRTADNGGSHHPRIRYRAIRVGDRTCEGPLGSRRELVIDGIMPPTATVTCRVCG
jgi:hypothetical protein